MLAKILERLTGKDGLERVAAKNNIDLLSAYLQERPVFVPQRPRRFLDASEFSDTELLEQIRKDLEQMSNDVFEPWILEVDGTTRLPVFSNERRSQAFASAISKDMNEVFALGLVAVLLSEVTTQVHVDVVELNLFSKQSWEIAVRES